MDYKQEKLLEWLKRLELYAQNENLPMRLVDSIRDLQKQVVAENADWHQLCINAENLLQSIGNKLKKQQTSQAIVTDCDVTIPIEEVRKKISEVLERGHHENAAAISNALYGSHAPIKECYRQINEIAGKRKTLRKIGNGNYFLKLFQKIKQSYEENIRRNFNDLATSVSNSCMRMMETIRSICKSINGYKLGFGEEEFYIKYSERKEGWDNQLRYNIANADLGAHVIMDFAQETLEKIRQITNKYKKEKNIRLAVPLAILVCIVLVSVFLSTNKATEDRSERTETTAVTIEMLDSVSNMVSNKTDNAVSRMLVIIFVLIAAYFVYAIIIVISFNTKRIAAQGECLRRESELFEKENRMDCHGEFEKIVDEYEQYYSDVLNEIFEKTTLNRYSEKQQNEYEQFCNELNSIQKM